MKKLFILVLILMLAVVCLPAMAQEEQPSEPEVTERPTKYVVQEGDTCESIAKNLFKVNFDLFMLMNEMEECTIEVEQTVLIPTKEEEEEYARKLEEEEAARIAAEQAAILKAAEEEAAAQLAAAEAEAAAAAAEAEAAAAAAEQPVEEEPVEEQPAEEPAAEEPAAEEPVEEPAAEEPVEEQPVEEPAAEQPAEEQPAEEPAAEEPVEEQPVEEPAAEQPVEEQPAEEPAAEQPVEEQPAEEPAAEQPVEEQPVEEPAAEQPVEEQPAEEPAAEQPVEEQPAEEPAAEQPVEEQPAEEPAAEQPVEEQPAEEPAAEQPAEEQPVEEPAAEEPVEEQPVEEPAAEQPVEEEPAEPELTEEEAAQLAAEEEAARIAAEEEAARIAAEAQAALEEAERKAAEITYVVHFCDLMTGENIADDLVGNADPDTIIDAAHIDDPAFYDDAVVYTRCAEQTSDLMLVEANGSNELTIYFEASEKETAEEPEIEVIDEELIEETEEIEDEAAAEGETKTVRVVKETGIFTSYEEPEQIVEVLFEGTELEVVAIEGESQWVKVILEDETEGYILTSDIEIIDEDETEDEEPEEEAETVEPLFTITTIETETAVRIAADGMSEIFTTLAEGTEIEVLAVEGDWLQVSIDDAIGYIYTGDAEVLNDEEPAEEEIAEETEKTEEADDASEDTPEEQVVETPKKVTIFTSRRTIMMPGEMITLTSKLEGFEDAETITYQWECDKGDGFEAVEGANSDSYSYPCDTETLSWDWRLLVFYN